MYLEITFIDGSRWKIDVQVISDYIARFNATQMTKMFKETEEYKNKYERSFKVEKKYALLNPSVLIDFLKKMSYKDIQPHLELIRLPTLDYSEEFKNAKIKIVEPTK